MGFFGKVVDKIKDTKERLEEKQDKQAKLKKWKDKLETSRGQTDLTIMDEREMIYNGTHDVDQNINDSYDYDNGRDQANNVQNITYEFTEAMVDNTLPDPSVKSKRPKYDTLAKVIEDCLRNETQEMNLETKNDMNERTTMIQGQSWFEIYWDNKFYHQLYTGRLRVDNPHPKRIIYQAGVYEVDEMDYIFKLTSMTKEAVKYKYLRDVSNQGEQYPDINYFSGDQYTNTESEKVTVIECYYRDENGDIGKFTWCNEIVLEDLPKYYLRRLSKCTKCGAVKGDSDICEAIAYDDLGNESLCGNNKFKKSIEEYEILDRDIVKYDGTIIPAGTQIPYYVPQSYPLINRKNVPVNFKLSGQSDVDVIRDQQDALKKIVSAMEEKVIRGGYIIKAENDHRFKLSNKLYQIVRGTPQQLAALGVESLVGDISKDLQVAQYMYNAAKDQLGVTNAWLGREDTTAKSGVAKQIQVQQSSGRMMSRMVNKYAAFGELYRKMFEFKLAFEDEERPYSFKNSDGQMEYGSFSRYDFLEQDASGEWYYNTDFIIKGVSGAEGLPRDKNWIMAKAVEFAQYGYIDPIQFWMIMEAVNFPMATQIKQGVMKRMEEQQAAADKDAVMGQLSPEEQAMAQQNPDLLQQAMGGA